MSEQKNQNNIGELLKDFQNEKETPNNEANTLSAEPPLETPVTYPEVEKDEPSSDDKTSKKVKKKINITIPELNKKQKKTLITVVASVVACVVILTSILFLVQHQRSAYLKPYKEKYGVFFPSGILEEHCDAYGQNPDIVGILKTQGEDILVSRFSNQNRPYLDANLYYKEIGFNTVIYATKEQLGFLETQYSTAKGYNSSSGIIQYDTLFDNVNWRVVSAFYINTKAEDDNDYIFPYNVTQSMTQSSYKPYFDQIASRSIYNTNYTLTRSDNLLTFSVETDFHKDFRFVLVCAKTNKSTIETKAKEKNKVRYPAVIYSEKKQPNPYDKSKKWYPEVYIGDGEDTFVQSVEDYKYF